MQRKILRTIALGSFALVVALGAAWQAQKQDAKTPYPGMAPLDQYLMERTAEIALARSAAPESISRDAGVMVLGRHGYEPAVEGKNGFSVHGGTRVRQEGIAATGSRRDVLHVVKATVLERP